MKKRTEFRVQLFDEVSTNSDQDDFKLFTHLKNRVQAFQKKKLFTKVQENIHKTLKIMLDEITRSENKQQLLLKIKNWYYRQMRQHELNCVGQPYINSYKIPKIKGRSPLMSSAQSSLKEKLAPTDRYSLSKKLVEQWAAENYLEPKYYLKVQSRSQGRRPPLSLNYYQFEEIPEESYSQDSDRTERRNSVVEIDVKTPSILVQGKTPVPARRHPFAARITRLRGVYFPETYRKYHKKKNLSLAWVVNMDA